MIRDHPGDDGPSPLRGFGISLFPEFRWRFTPGFIPSHLRCFDPMLQPGNLLSWNVWFKAPKLVDQEEWRTHAERWRKSIDEGHGAHAGGPARYFDGTLFNPLEAEIEKKVLEILHWIYAHLKDLKR